MKKLMMSAHSHEMAFMKWPFDLFSLLVPSHSLDKKKNKKKNKKKKKKQKNKR